MARDWIFCMMLKVVPIDRFCPKQSKDTILQAPDAKTAKQIGNNIYFGHQESAPEHLYELVTSAIHNEIESLLKERFGNK